MGTKKAEKLQADLGLNNPKEFSVGGKKYKIHRLSNWVSLKMSELIIESESMHGVEGTRSEMLNAIVRNRTLAPKCISLIMLKSTIKVKLFHWIKWRMLHWFGNQEEYNGILDQILNDQDTMFFFQNIALLQSSNMMESEMTMMSTKNIIAEHGSEVSTI